MDFILDYNEPKQMVDNDLMPNRTSPNALKYITKVKAYLMRFALCKNNCDFSMNWLNRSENYYALLLCKERIPSVSCMQYLLHKLQKASNEAEKYNKHAIATQLDRLVDEGDIHLANKLREYR